MRWQACILTKQAKLGTPVLEMRIQMRVKGMLACDLAATWVHFQILGFQKAEENHFEDVVGNAWFMTAHVVDKTGKPLKQLHKSKERPTNQATNKQTNEFWPLN